jgi:hypothetical protein
MVTFLFGEEPIAITTFVLHRISAFVSKLSFVSASSQELLPMGNAKRPSTPLSPRYFLAVHP